MRNITCILSLISCLGFLCSCKKENDTPPPFPTYYSKGFDIIDYYPNNVFQGDTFTIKGSFITDGIDSAKFSFTSPWTTLEYEYFTPLKITSSEVTLIIPELRTLGDNKAYNGKIHFSLKMHVDDTTYIWRTDSVIQYNYYGPYGSIWPTSGRPGQHITLQGTFSRAYDNLAKIKFPGTSEWVLPSGYDSANYNGSYYMIGALYRIPQGAKNGELQIWAQNHKVFNADSALTVFPEMNKPQKGIWVRQGNFGTRKENDDNLRGGGRSGAVVFTIGEKAYIIGGHTHAPFDGYGSNTVWEFDAKYNCWLKKADFPGGNRTDAIGFSIGNKGYFGCGADKDGVLQKDFWEYDSSSDKWSRLSDFIGNACENATSFVINGKGYVTGGQNENLFFSDMYEYNPETNLWSTKNAQPVARSCAYAFVVDGKAYVGGGLNSNGKLFDLYQFDGNLWVAKTGMPTQASIRNVSFVLNGKAYVGCGGISTPPTTQGTSEMFEYLPSSDNWRQLQNVGNDDRFSGIGFSIDGVGYIGLGVATYATHTHRDIWAYTP